MRWQGRRQSRNIEDRRGMRLSRGAGIGGVGTIVLILVALYLGQDPATVLQGVGQMTGGGQAEQVPYQETAEEAAMREFTAVVLADTEDTWHALFQASGQAYVEPSLVLFSGAVESACGFAQSAVGPFYCPADQRVYIDLSFYRDLHARLGAGGDFAQAYVIAHEVGHHVQTLLGISARTQAARQSVGEAEANALSVRQELQADCFAGLWAHYADRTRQLLEAGDIEEGLNAASAIGDDRLQMRSRGYVSPDSFTHGSSAQRVRWFRQGYASGDASTCNTFDVEELG